MRKTHPLTHPRHKKAQAIAAVKNTLRKYIKRERRKDLPEGKDYWDFDCRLGIDEETAEPTHVNDLIKGIDGFVAKGAESVYVEILAKASTRRKRIDKDDI